MAKEPFDQDLDALPQDLHHMLGDAPPAPPAGSRRCLCAAKRPPGVWRR